MLLVVFHHLDLLSSDGVVGGIRRVFFAGYIGVDIFFVLSGFLITDLLLRERDATGRIDLVRFWRARALRLLPALAVFVGVFVAYDVLVGFPESGNADATVSTAISAMTFTANWHLTENIAAYAPELGHLWSLSIEEQFYLFWPFVVWALAAPRRRPAVVLSGLAVAVIVAATWQGVVFRRSGWVAAYVRTDARLVGVLIGAVVAYVFFAAERKPTFRLPRPSWSKALASVGALAIAVFLVLSRSAEDSFVFSGGFAVVSIAAAAIIAEIVRSTRGDDPWFATRLLDWAPLRAIGRVSYAVYLWHFFVYRVVGRWGVDWTPLATMLVAWSLTAVIVIASWFAVELPAQRLRRRLDEGRARRHGAQADTGGARDERIPSGHRVPLWIGAASVALSTAVVVAAGRAGRLTPQFVPGGRSSNFADLRVEAVARLESVPPRGQLLADAVPAGGLTFDSTNWLPVLARLPVHAVFGRTGSAVASASIVAALLVAVAVVGTIAAVLARRAGRDRRSSFVLAAGVGSIVLSAVVLAIGPAQRLEDVVWCIAAGALAVLCVAEFARSPDAVRAVAVAAACLLAAIGHPWLGAGAVALVGAVGIVLLVRRRPGAAAVPGVVVGLVVVASLAWVVGGFGPTRSSEHLEVPVAFVGWDLPGESERDALFVEGQCAEVFAGTGSSSAPWSIARYGWIEVVAILDRPPTRAGEETIVRISGQPRVDVRLVSRADGLVRVEIAESRAGSRRPPTVVAAGRWITGATRVRVPITVRLDGASLVVAGAGEELDRRDVVDVLGDVRNPELAFVDGASSLGVPIGLSDRGALDDDRCEPVLARALEAALFTPRLPERAAPGALVVEGPCLGLYSATTDRAVPWRTLALPPAVAEVVVGDAVPPGRQVVLADGNGDGVVGVEVSDVGEVRFRTLGLGVNVVGEWTKHTDGTFRVRADYSGPADHFVIRVDGDVLAVVPDVSAGVAAEDAPSPRNPARPTRLATVETTDADPDPPTGSVTVTAVEQFTPVLCQGALDHAVFVNVDDPGATELDPAAGVDFVVVGDCASLLSAPLPSASSDETVEGPGQDAEPWSDVGFPVDVVAPAEENEVVEVVAVSETPPMGVYLEFDGDRSVRPVVAVPFLREIGDWRQVSIGDRLEFSLRSDEALDRWIVEMDGVEIGRLPLSLTDGDRAIPAELIFPNVESETVQRGVGSAADREMCEALGV